MIPTQAGAQAPAQAGRRPTVGDTITVVQRVAAPPGALVQPRPPGDTLVATWLAPPEVSREGDSVRIAYTLTVWAPGRNDLELPGAILVTRDGAVDTLPAARVRLEVTSVLPADTRPETVPPRAARPWVPRADRTGLPWLVLVPLALLVLAAAGWAWRRRGPVPPPVTAPASPRTPTARLEAWLAQGEAALVVDHLATDLRDAPEAEDWRAAVAAVRFTPGAGAALAALAREGLARRAIHDGGGT